MSETYGICPQDEEDIVSVRNARRVAHLKKPASPISAWCWHPNIAAQNLTLWKETLAPEELVTLLNEQYQMMELIAQYGDLPDNEYAKVCRTLQLIESQLATTSTEQYG